MAQPPGKPIPQKVPPQNDIYTVQLVIAAVLLLIGIIVLAARTTALFDSLIPPTGA